MKHGAIYMRGAICIDFGYDQQNLTVDASLLLPLDPSIFHKISTIKSTNLALEKRCLVYLTSTLKNRFSTSLKSNKHTILKNTLNTVLYTFFKIKFSAFEEFFGRPFLVILTKARFLILQVLWYSS
ncbi:hypothetical protein BpHYR1_005586 [Brachionus plicatilis]|uniref:Uncharacterized protein n=1 Tax=Brachionus plicatilis TaxID=10195 RepID=A0A3M7RIQ4_BRAPC|nr:hypothetical protein BpHYR1_005586 [Brachionus plicatilis]